MESGSRADHGTIVTPVAAPGHESHGVHVCSKCGWPFPNPHPNARHRRAHKKICGTLPGYTLLPPQLQTTGLSPVSDDGQLSDEDLKTPSPKDVQRSQFEMSSDGPGGRSNKSEDDVYSDAVDDFADAGSTPGFQQRLEEGFKGTVNKKDAANVVESREDVINGGTSVETPQMQISELQPDRVAPTSEECVPVATTDMIEKEPGDESANAGGVLMSDLNPVISGNQMNDFGEAANDNANDLKDTSQKENDQTTAEVPVVDGLVSSGDDAAVDLSEGMPNTEKAVFLNSSSDPNFGISQLDVEHAAKADEVLQLKEEFHEKVETRSSLDDMKSTNHTNASGDTVEVKVDGPVAPASASTSESVEGVNCMDDENAHVLSVRGDIKHVDNAEAMVEGFKGEGSKSLQSVNLASDGTTNDFKESGFSVDDGSSSPTRQLVESSLSTGSEVLVLGDSPEVKGESSTLIESDIVSSAEVLLDMNQQVPSADREAEQLERPADTHTGTYEMPNTEGSDVVDNRKTTIMEPHKEAEQLERPAVTHSGTYEVPNNEGSDVGENSKTTIVESHKEAEQLERPADTHTGTSEVPNTDGSDVSDNSKTTIVESHKEAEQLERPADIHSGIHEVPNNEGPDVGDNSSTTIVEPHEEDDQTASEADNIIFENERLHGPLDRPDATGAENSASSSLVDKNVSMKIEETLEPGVEHTQTGVSTQGLQEAKSIETSLLEGVNATDCQGEIIERDVTPVAETEGSVSDPVMEKSSVLVSKVIESTDVHESSTIADNATERQLKEESARTNMCEVSNSEASLEKLQSESTHGVGGTSKLDKGEDPEVLQKSSQEPAANSDLTSSLESGSVKDAAVQDDCTRDLVGDASHEKPEPFSKEGDSSAKQLGTSVADFSVDSNSQTDSLDGHWGSVSVFSTQSDMPASATKTNAPQDSDKTDMFEAPSFMTLVEPRTASDQKAAGASSEIHSVQNPQQSKAQAGWFPSITNVVNESQGRKKNEEIIAKVTNWSNTGKQHTPLKSLLGEANQELKSRSSPTHAKQNAAGVDKGSRDNGVRSTAIQEEGAARRKEWNSPARYPAEIKREKRKEKGRPYWAHLVCCASVN